MSCKVYAGKVSNNVTYTIKRYMYKHACTFISIYTLHLRSVNVYTYALF